MFLDPTMLRDSFDLIIDRRPDLTKCFHEVLRQRYPSLDRMFRDYGSTQSKLLARVIADVIDRPEHLAWQPVPDEISSAILATLATVADEAWTVDIAEQWMLACKPIVQRLLEELTTARAA